MQGEVLQRIQDLAETMESDAVIDSEAAFRELLKGRSEYTLGDSTTLAPFKLESVSMPDDLSCCRAVEDFLDTDSRRYLEWRERMLKTEEEMAEHPPNEVIPYSDPALVNQPRKYLQFIKKLMSIDFLVWTRRPKCRVGTFFVWKSNGKSIRMIIDARRANRMFKDPPGVELCTAEGFSRTEVCLPDGVDPWSPESIDELKKFGLHVGLADIDNCFHRCKQPKWLSEYFAMDPVKASSVGMTGVEVDGVISLLGG